MTAVVAPVLHRNETPPEAVNVAESPGQLGGVTQVITHVGPVPTVTVVEHELVQPLGPVTVTV